VNIHQPGRDGAPANVNRVNVGPERTSLSKAHNLAAFNHDRLARDDLARQHDAAACQCKPAARLLQCRADQAYLLNVTSVAAR
jgi:hypothetical protein